MYINQNFILFFFLRVKNSYIKVVFIEEFKYIIKALYVEIDEQIDKNTMYTFMGKNSHKCTHTLNVFLLILILLKIETRIIQSELVHTIRDNIKGTSVFMSAVWEPELFSFASSFFHKNNPRDCFLIPLGGTSDGTY